MTLVLKTAIFSFIVQIISGIFLLMAFFYKLQPKDMILKSIVTLELIVQVLEGIFYFFIIKKLSSGNFETSFRYYDWFLSTPAMLISTLLFLVYLNSKPFEENKDESVDLNVKNIFEKNKMLVFGVVWFNALMLLLGFYGEKGRLGKGFVFYFGTLFLVLSFYFLSKFSEERYGKLFLSVMFVIWAMYGVAFMMPMDIKNISYNILDLFSKNFYGVFLYILMAIKYKRFL